MNNYFFNIKKSVVEGFEKLFRRAVLKAEETDKVTYLYLYIAGEYLKISKSQEKCWDNNTLTVKGTVTTCNTYQRKNFFHTTDRSIDLLSVDPEKTKFVIEEQGYSPVKRQMVFPKKLREAIREAKALLGAEKTKQRLGGKMFKEENKVFDLSEKTYTDLSGSAVIRQMQECTDKQKVLRILDWSWMTLPLPEEGEDFLDILEFPMDWGNDMDECIAVEEFETVLEHLKKIAALRNSLIGNAVADKALLGTDCYNTWYTYIRPFAAVLSEDIDSLDLAACTDAQIEEYNVFCEARKREATRRLKNRPLAFATIIHAMRYVRVCELGAPECVLKAEERMLAASYAITHNAVSNKVA